MGKSEEGSDAEAEAELNEEDLEADEDEGWEDDVWEEAPQAGDEAAVGGVVYSQAIDLTDANMWDDSALIKAFDESVAKYQIAHQLKKAPKSGEPSAAANASGTRSPVPAKERHKKEKHTAEEQKSKDKAEKKHKEKGEKKQRSKEKEGGKDKLARKLEKEEKRREKEERKREKEEQKRKKAERKLREQTVEGSGFGPACDVYGAAYNAAGAYGGGWGWPGAAPSQWAADWALYYATQPPIPNQGYPTPLNEPAAPVRPATGGVRRSRGRPTTMDEGGVRGAAAGLARSMPGRGRGPPSRPRRGTMGTSCSTRTASPSRPPPAVNQLAAPPLITSPARRTPPRPGWASRVPPASRRPRRPPRGARQRVRVCVAGQSGQRVTADVLGAEAAARGAQELFSQCMLAWYYAGYYAGQYQARYL